jgi:hypothetical protein
VTPTHSAAAGERRLRVPVAVALVGTIVALLAAAIGTVVSLSFLTARDNTVALLRDRAEVGSELLEARVRSQLDPVSATGGGLAAMIGTEAIDPTDAVQVRAAFLGALAAVPQASAVIYVDTNLRSARVSRNGDPLLEVVQAGLSILDWAA